MGGNDIIKRYNQLNYSPYTYLNGWSDVLSNINKSAKIKSDENIVQNN